jgi:hypothetical protein
LWDSHFDELNVCNGFALSLSFSLWNKGILKDVPTLFAAQPSVLFAERKKEGAKEERKKGMSVL